MPRKNTAPKTRATLAGASDGQVRAWIDPDGSDPTGGFIKRPELGESERSEYVAAYDAGFLDTLKIRGVK
jgi:hypothetical protein